MSWRGYAKAFALSNLVVGLVVWVQFMTQAWLPLNPDDIPNMRWDTALHTMVSFLTNTNQQHYSGQAQLSYLSQMVGIVGLQVVTPMMGLAIVVATLRGSVRRAQDDTPGPRAARSAKARTRPGQLLGRRHPRHAALHAAAVPAVVGAADLAGRAVDAAGAARSSRRSTPASEMKEQKIPLGPVAPMVAIKQLGTNGGGWYGPNSAVPLENPTPLSNLLETLGDHPDPGRRGLHGRPAGRPPAAHRDGVRQHAADVGRFDRLRGVVRRRIRPPPPTSR